MAEIKDKVVTVEGLKAKHDYDENTYAKKDSVSAETLNRKTADDALSGRIDNLIANAGGLSSNTEIVDARVDAKGGSHTTLKGRIDADINRLDERIVDIEIKNPEEVELVTKEDLDELKGRINRQDNSLSSLTLGINEDGSVALFINGIQHNDAISVVSGSIIEGDSSYDDIEKSIITISDTSFTAGVGVTKTITAFSSDPDVTIQWISSNESVAICVNGLITITGIGNCKIVALGSDGAYAECNIVGVKASVKDKALFGFETDEITDASIAEFKDALRSFTGCTSVSNYWMADDSITNIVVAYHMGDCKGNDGINRWNNSNARTFDNTRAGYTEYFRIGSSNYSVNDVDMRSNNDSGFREDGLRLIAFNGCNAIIPKTTSGIDWGGCLFYPMSYGRNLTLCANIWSDVDSQNTPLYMNKNEGTSFKYYVFDNSNGDVSFESIQEVFGL